MGKPQTMSLFSAGSPRRAADARTNKTTERVGRLDVHGDLRERILPLCRLQYGEIWEDPLGRHKVGVLDATQRGDVHRIMSAERAPLVLNDPPYNLVVGNANTAGLFKLNLDEFMDFSRKWLENAVALMAPDAHLYVWTGADYKADFQPLPDLIVLLREFRQLRPRNIITMRNQRGYGTQKNWMWVRQELLYYVKGDPPFYVDAEYTDIPKTVRGYYKRVGGRLTENLERSRSAYIRAGNVWVDVQQVFYRMEENVPGCYAQKPLKAIERIILSATREQDVVADFFAHSGTTLIAGERLRRPVRTFDIDPVFAEITIRRLERFRKTGKTGWQWHNPFPELGTEGEA